MLDEEIKIDYFMYWQGGIVMRLVYLASHPDDEVLSSAVLLLRARELGFKTHVVWLTRGQASRSPDAASRWDEALRVAAQLGATCICLEMKDGDLNASEAINTIDKVLSAIKPHVVVWPTGVGPEHHQDHRVLHEAMLNISKRSGLQRTCWLVGQAPVFADPEFRPNLFLPFDSLLLSKAQALMGLYESENGKRFARPSFMEQRARHWAHEGQTLTTYAEPFFLVKGLPPTELFRSNAVEFAEDETGVPVMKYLETFNVDIQGIAFSLVEALSVYGTDLPEEFSRILSGSLRLLSARCESGYINIIYGLDSENTFVILHAVLLDNDRISPHDLTIAEKRMNAWLRDQLIVAEAPTV